MRIRSYPYCGHYFKKLVLKSQDKNPSQYEASPKARPDIWIGTCDNGLHTIGKDQLQGPEGGVQAGRDELEGLNHEGEGQEPRQSHSSKNAPVRPADVENIWRENASRLQQGVENGDDQS